MERLMRKTAGLLAFLVILTQIITIYQPLKAETTSSTQVEEKTRTSIEEEVVEQTTEINEKGEEEEGFLSESLQEEIVTKRNLPQATAIITSVYLTDRNGLPFTEENPAILDSGINIYFTWKIPENLQIVAGDTYTFDLPQIFEIYSPISGLLNEYGRYDVDISGHVTLTFNEKTAMSDDVHGTLEIHSYLDKETVVGSTKQEVVFPVGDGYTVEIIIQPTGGKPLTKNGKIDAAYNGKKATWSIEVNTNKKHLNSVTMVDTIPAGMSYIEGSLKIYKLLVDINGVSTVGEPVDSAIYSVSSIKEKISVLISQEGTSAYLFVFDTLIDQPETYQGQKYFENTAILKDGDTYLGTGSATVSTKYGKALEKTAVYKPQTQSFDWTIKYNYNQLHILKEKAWIEDLFTRDFDITSGPEIYEVTIDSLGKELVSPTPIDATLYDVVPIEKANEHGFLLKFKNDISQAYVIKYSITANKIIDINGEVKNKVVTGSESKIEVGGKYQQHGVIKSKDFSNVTTKEVGWKVILNGDKHSMNNLFVKDVFQYENYRFKAGTLIIKDLQDNSVLVENSDYQFKLIDENPQKGFTIQFIGAYKKTNHSFEIKYTTSYSPIYYQGRGNDVQFKNNISIQWTSDDGEEHGGTDTQTYIPPKPTKESGEKTAKYNAQTKDVTWSIFVNYNRLLLKNAVIEDSLNHGLKYVKGSAEVFYYEIKENGAIVEGAPVDPQDYTLEEPNELSSTIRLTIHLEDKSSIGLRFKTAFTGELIEASTYKNQAVFQSNGEKYRYEATVVIPNGGSYVRKIGQQENDRIHWEIPINYSQSTLEKVVVIDTPSSSHVLLEETLQIYKTIVSPEGGVVVDKSQVLQRDVDYTFVDTSNHETGAFQFKIAFLKTIHQGYSLQYSSQIVGVVGEKATNKVEIQGENKKIITQETVNIIEVKRSTGIGTGTGRVGNLIISKEDAKTNKIIAGAEFKLFLANGTTMLRVGITKHDGTIQFKDLRKGKYILKETKAPDGYIIDPQYGQGVEVILDYDNIPEGESKTITEHVQNEPTKVMVKKVDGATGVAIQGAKFAVFSVGEEMVETFIAEGRSDEFGYLEFTNLVPGEYILKEVEATSGYILNTRIQKFNITLSAEGTSQVPVMITKRNFQGAAELVKQAVDGTNLEGAVFQVMTAEGEVVQENLHSNQQGIVKAESLPPGSYYFEETKAPSGYILNTEKYPFTIVSAADDLPAINKEAGVAINYQGKIKVKKNDENKRALLGAQFKIVMLKDSEGKRLPEQRLIAENLISSITGDVVFEQLAPGSYALIEIIAPVGKILNNAPLYFEVPDKVLGAPQEIDLGIIYNYSGSVRFKKVDAKGAPLAKASFAVLDSDGTVVQNELISAKDGQVVIDNLAPGTYTIIEKVAPEGYLLSNEKITVTIASEGLEVDALQELTDFVNEQVPESEKGTLPETGVSMKEQLVYSSSLFIVSAAVCLWIIGKGKQQIK